MPRGSFQLMDLAGKVVLQRKTHPDESRIYISKSDFAGGVYIFRYTQSTGKTVAQKVVMH
jgi:hypothetical protein